MIISLTVLSHHRPYRSGRQASRSVLRRFLMFYSHSIGLHESASQVHPWDFSKSLGRVVAKMCEFATRQYDFRVLAHS